MREQGTRGRGKEQASSVLVGRICPTYTRRSVRLSASEYVRKVVNLLLLNSTT